MGRCTFTPEQIVAKLRKIEVLVASGKAAALACKEADIAEQTYCRWRKDYGGLELDLAKWMKDLERENAQLKRWVADLSLERQVPKDIASGSLWRPTGLGRP